MAGSKLDTRVKASSIVEVIIAMVVIMVVFSIAMGIFANVQKLSLSAKKIQAQALLKEQLLKAEQAPQIGKQTIATNDFSIEQDISIYNNNNSLFQVTLTAWDTNKEQVAGLKEVIDDGR